MRSLKPFILTALLCLVAVEASQPGQGASSSAVLAMLQSELQRSFHVLNTETVPDFFIVSPVYDKRSPYIAASNAALERSDEQRGRFATVEVRVGDYLLDNPHPLRGDTGSAGPRMAAVTLPLTDEERPIRLALWRATDRPFKQATEAFTRVKTNVASKIREEDPAADFSRENAQTYIDTPVSYTVDTALWEGGRRRISAPFADDPLVLESNVSLSIAADNRSYVDSEGAQVATGAV